MHPTRMRDSVFKEQGPAHPPGLLAHSDNSTDSREAHFTRRRFLVSIPVTANASADLPRTWGDASRNQRALAHIATCACALRVALPRTRSATIPCLRLLLRTSSRLSDARAARAMSFPEPFKNGPTHRGSQKRRGAPRRPRPPAPGVNLTPASRPGDGAGNGSRSRAAWRAPL